MSSFRDDAPPWSFFIPITLAVMVGVLAADAIRYAIGTVFGGDDAPGQVSPLPRPTLRPRRRRRSCNRRRARVPGRDVQILISAMGAARMRRRLRLSRMKHLRPVACWNCPTR